MRELTKSEAEAVSGGITRSPYTPGNLYKPPSPLISVKILSNQYVA